jgi:hypothetical protein
MGYPVQLGITSTGLDFLLVLASDHITGATGVTPTVTLLKAGESAFSAATGTVSELGSGWYRLSPSSTDISVVGPLLLHATAAGCDPRDDTFVVVNYNPAAVTPLSPPTTATSGTTTALDLINGALQLITVQDQFEDVNAAEAQDALRRLNNMIDRWSSEKLTIYAIARSVYDTVADQGTYEIGPGGDWDQVRPPAPSFITGANLILTTFTPSTEIQLYPMTDDEYRLLPQKGLTSTYPTAYHYEATYPLGSFSVFPVPANGDSDIALYSQSPLAGFASLTTQYSFPPGYAEAIEYNLAKRLSVPYGKRLEPDVREMADDGLGLIKRTNTRMIEIYSEVGVLFGGRRRPYNIFTGP